MKYSIEALQLAFNKTWDRLSEDEGMLKFFTDENSFLDYFTKVNREDELGAIMKVDDNGHHRKELFYMLYRRLAMNLHPDKSRVTLSLDECKTVFTTLENRPSKEDDLKESLLIEDSKFIEKMKSVEMRDQMYGYLYYHIYKGMIEQLVNTKNEIKDEILYKQLREGHLSIKQSCMVIAFLGRQIINFKHTASLCGFSEKSVKAFRDFFTECKNDESYLYNHGRDTAKDFERVLSFLKEFHYDVSLANNGYLLFKQIPKLK